MEFRNIITCKGIEYQTSVNAIAETLSISISDMTGQYVWIGNFTSKQIEALTSKVGSSKNFATFCKLLTASLQGKNPSLRVEFFSYQDIENMRKGNNLLNISTRPSKKKYLIISYVNDFEKAHYPLTLFLQDTSADRDFEVSKPTPDFLAENTKLKQENIILSKNLNNFKDEFLTYREKSERKIEELRRTNQELENEIQRMKEELDLIIAQLEEEAKKRSSQSSNYDIKLMKAALTREKEENSILKYELANCQKEIEFLRASDGSNKKLIDVLSKKIDFNEERDSDSPLSSDSPQHGTPMKGVSESNNELKAITEFGNQITKLKHLTQKNKS